MKTTMPMILWVRACLMISLAALLVAPAYAQQPAAGAGPGATPLKMQAAEISAGALNASILSVTKAGLRIVAVGDHGVVLLSDDDGAHFRQAKSVPVRSTLTGVSFADDKNGWAVGQWGVVLNTVDGGENWKVQRSDTTIDQPLFSVYFKDKEQGWAVGLWSLVLTTQDGGKSWTTIKLPEPPGGGKIDRNLYKIFANSKGTLFITAEQGMVLRSVDSGANWMYLTTGYKGSFWSGIANTDGTLLVGGLRGSIYLSKDDGDTWQAIASNNKSSITDFAQIGPKTFAVGLDGVMLESDDMEQTFKATQREDRQALTAAIASNGNKLIVFSKKGLLSDNNQSK